MPSPSVRESNHAAGLRQALAPPRGFGRRPISAGLFLLISLAVPTLGRSQPKGKPVTVAGGRTLYDGRIEPDLKIAAPAFTQLRFNINEAAFFFTRQLEGLCDLGPYSQKPLPFQPFLITEYIRINLWEPCQEYAFFLGVR